jgi:hypothetical protein
MHNRAIFLILFFSCMALYPQSNNTSVQNIYKGLSRNNLHYIEFLDSIKLIQGYQKNGMEKADFLELNIFESINLKFKKFTYSNPNPVFYFRDSIFLFDKKYCIDNLFYEKKVLKIEEPLRLNYASGYSFSLNSKKYISLFFWDSTLPTSNLSYYIILFDVSDKKNIKSYFFDEQMSFTPNCFGDFNNDGKLDFANWTYDNHFECLTLVGNTFKRIKNKFVVVKEKSHGIFEINWIKSNWFR